MFTSKTNKEADSIASDVEDKASGFKQQAHERAETLEETVRHAGRKARKMFMTAEHRAEDINSQFICNVRSKPLTSIATAVAAGFFVGLIYRRLYPLP